jgi:hypothetical protein
MPTRQPCWCDRLCSISCATREVAGPCSRLQANRCRFGQCPALGVSRCIPDTHLPPFLVALFVCVPQDLADKLLSAPAVTSSQRFSRTKRSTSAFTLQHYAGPVSYSLDNFLDKNKDYVVAEHASLLAAADNCLLSELFAEPAAPATEAKTQNGRTVGAVIGGGGWCGGLQAVWLQAQNLTCSMFPHPSCGPCCLSWRKVVAAWPACGTPTALGYDAHVAAL